MNPLKQLYKAVVPEAVRNRVWCAVRSFPATWRLSRHAIRYRLTHFRWTSRRTILCYPHQPPSTAFALRKICLLNGYRITTDPAAAFDIAVNWEDVTWRRPDDRVRDIARRGRCLNAGCADISKRFVQEVFHQVFGYSLAVDPLTHQGLCVEKSDVNFKHDGRVVTCPLKDRHADRVYQRLVNNRHGESAVEEIRVPVFGRSLPFVCLKYRNIDDRFRNYFRSVLKNTSDVLTAGERDQIRRFCERLKLDYGELDVLRDSDDGRIYIVDANTTPSGPPRHLSAAEEWQTLCLMAETFEQEFLRGPDQDFFTG